MNIDWQLVARILLVPLKFILVLALGFAVAVVVTQDIFLLPGAVTSLGKKDWSLPPDGVEAFTLNNPDGTMLEVWRVGATSEISPKVGVVFHGNGDTVRSTIGFLRWLQNLGITAYGFSLRGFGKSTGWPSERGLYSDAELVVQEALRREQLTSRELVLVGNSFGTGIAAYAAQKFNSRAVVLFAPYSSIPEVVREREFFRPFAAFVRFNLPTIKYLDALNTTCIILAHGEKDGVITVANSKRILDSLAGHANVHSFIDPEADHVGIISSSLDQIGKWVQECPE